MDDTGHAVHRARPLHELIHLSFDDGHSWQAVTIDTGCGAMGSMCEVEPDLVLYCYNGTFDTWVRAQFLRVTPGGLEPARLA